VRGKTTLLGKITFRAVLISMISSPEQFYIETLRIQICLVMRRRGLILTTRPHSLRVFLRPIRIDFRLGLSTRLAGVIDGIQLGLDPFVSLSEHPGIELAL
jgi:hypothetical protein